MKGPKIPNANFIQEEAPPKFEFDFNIINKQINQLRESLAAVFKDGRLQLGEFDRILEELRTLEDFLVAFLDNKFKENIKPAAEFFNSRLRIAVNGGEFSQEDMTKYGFKEGGTIARQGYNKEILYIKYIHEYLRALMRVANKASFKLGNGRRL